MKITGIIAEYNPLHQGHIYQMEQAKQITQCDCLVVILTGCFSQRGLPSLLSLQNKTKLALRYGANLVLECPVCYGSQSADYFARFMIESLSCLPVDFLCFGSETNNIHTLESLLEQIEMSVPNPSKSLNQNIDMNLKPNDILGLQYIRYCRLYGIKPISIQRNDSFMSATETRQRFFNGETLFKSSLFLKEQRWESYYPYLRLYLQMTEAKDIAEFHLVNEGIEHRLKQCAQSESTWTGFLKHCTSKTYSRARIQRTCLMILLQIKKEEMKHASFHKIKVLGLDTIGRQCLKNAQTDAIITRFNQMDPFLQKIHKKTWALYNSVLTNPIEESPVILYDR